MNLHIRSGWKASNRFLKKGGASAVKSFAETKAARNTMFKHIGSPSVRGAFKNSVGVSPAVAIRRGKRRTAVIGSALAANAVLGPRGSQGSSGSRGYVQPRSSGGYA